MKENGLPDIDERSVLSQSAPPRKNLASVQWVAHAYLVAFHNDYRLLGQNTDDETRWLLESIELVQLFVRSKSHLL